MSGGKRDPGFGIEDIIRSDRNVSVAVNMISLFLGNVMWESVSSIASSVVDFSVSAQDAISLPIDAAFVTAIGYLATRDLFLRSQRLQRAAYTGAVVGTYLQEGVSSLSTVGALAIPLAWVPFKNALTHRTNYGLETDSNTD